MTPDPDNMNVSLPVACLDVDACRAQWHAAADQQLAQFRATVDRLNAG